MSLFVKPDAANAGTPTPASVFGAAANSSRQAFGTSSSAANPRSVFGAAKQSAPPAPMFGGGGGAQATAPRSLFSSASQNQTATPQSGTRSMFSKPNQGSLFGKTPSTGATPQSVFGAAAAAQKADTNPARSLFSSAARSQQHSTFGSNSRSNGNPMAFTQQSQQVQQKGGSLFMRPSANQQPQASQKPTGGFSKPKTLFGKSTATATGGLDFLFSLLSDLTLEEKQAYDAGEFELGCIPIKPPPRELVA